MNKQQAILLVEQFLREMSSGHATGGLIGQTFAQEVVKNEKPILELLKLATASIMKSGQIIPQIKIIGKDQKSKLINIADIKDKTKQLETMNNWVLEATDKFIEIVSKIRTLSIDDKVIIKDYFANFTNQHPEKGKEELDGQIWN